MKRSVLFSELREVLQTTTRFNVHEQQAIVGAVDRALNQIKERAAAAKPIRKVRNAKAPALMSLLAWEQLQGTQLTIRNVQDWVTAKQLCPVMVMELIQEFRTEMFSKNKQYAAFDAAFKVYLTKGYLSKQLAEAKLAVSSHSQRVVRSIRGSSI